MKYRKRLVSARHSRYAGLLIQELLNECDFDLVLSLTFSEKSAHREHSLLAHTCSPTDSGLNRLFASLLIDCRMSSLIEQNFSIKTEKCSSIVILV